MPFRCNELADTIAVTCAMARSAILNSWRIEGNLYSISLTDMGIEPVFRA